MKVALTPALLGVLLRHTCPGCGGDMPAGQGRCDQCRAVPGASAAEDSAQPWGPVVSAAAGHPAPRALGEALLDGPAGVDPAGVALVGLLEAAGLLACPELAEWCVYFDDDGYAEIDLAQLSVSLCAAAVELTDAQRRTVRAALSLVDLAAELWELPEPTRRLVVDALAAFVADIAAGDATAAAYRAAAAGGGRR